MFELYFCRSGTRHVSSAKLAAWPSTWKPTRVITSSPIVRREYHFHSDLVDQHSGSPLNTLLSSLKAPFKSSTLMLCYRFIFWPFCADGVLLFNRHIPKAKATTVVETPEMRRLAENTKLQSQVLIHFNSPHSHLIKFFSGAIPCRLWESKGQVHSGGRRSRDASHQSKQQNHQVTVL